MILTGLGGGTPGGSTTQLQYNNAGVFGGFGAWDGTTLTVPGVANHLTLAGAVADAPVILAPTGSDPDIAIYLRPKGGGFVQLGPDTYSASGWAAGPESTGTEYIVNAGVAPDQYGHYVEMNSGDVAGAFCTGIYTKLVAGSLSSVNDQGAVGAFVASVESNLPSGRTLASLEGANFLMGNYGDGHVAKAAALFLQTGMDGTVSGGAGTGTVLDMYGMNYWLYQDNGTITNQYGYSVKNFHTAGVTTNMYLFYAGDFAGAATNPYYLWFDSRGVYRIREDNVADGAGNPQAIPALYNPRFTKYTPGAADHERGVQQWVGNVFQIGTEAGGTGTLRAVQIIGASLTVPGGTLLKTSSALTNGAAAALGTLTNAPAAGNPTKWIPIDDNGTTRYIPAW